MPLRLAIRCILSLVLITAAFAEAAFAQDIVTDCDRYAASRLDPRRKAAGVELDKIDFALAVPACEDAVRQFPDGMRLAYQLGRAYERANKLIAAVEQYRKAADQNYAAAQLALAEMYSTGQGVAQDDQQYIFWLRKAADQGYAVAQDALGYIYLDGRGIPKDEQQAAAWFRKAADQGYVPAQNKLGFMYRRQGFAPAQGQAWFYLPERRGCSQGRPARSRMVSQSGRSGIRTVTRQARLYVPER